MVFHRAIKQKLVYSNPMIHAYIYVTANLILQIHFCKSEIIGNITTTKKLSHFIDVSCFFLL